MKKWKTVKIASGLLIILLLLSAFIVGTVFAEDEDEGGMDHTPFFVGETYATGPEVTAKCLTCHVDASQEVMGTTHWTWEFIDSSGEELGKINVINNYCVAVKSNWKRCTSCHVGYGWANDDFNFEDESAVDCLVCHAEKSTYSKYPLAGGHPVYEGQELDWPKGSGNMVTPVDLVAAASSVAMPTRENCGTCHFYGGGAPGVKHGDLDPAMNNPSLELDVHMSPDGEDFTCQTCHTGGHDIQGSHYEYDLEGETGLLACESCHTDVIHEDEALNTHTDVIACQTCHIPTYAREFPTKTFWTWENAGDKETGVVKTEVLGVTVDTYNFKKGTFEWGGNLAPTYMWFNGETDWVTTGEVVDPTEPIALNTMGGGFGKEGSKIYPFKPMEGTQPFDAGNSMIAVPHLFPGSADDTDAYWKGWDWTNAVAAGQASVGVEFGGELDWVDTVMYWPLTHQVAPAADALACESCHAAEGLLDFAGLGYSSERVELLTTFPPVVEEVVVEVVEEVEDTVEEVEDAADEVIVDEVEAEETGSNTMLYLILLGALVLIVIVWYLVSRKKK
jgi:octaheme c-type cytochrome (tetrathionate reductase family)